MLSLNDLVQQVNDELNMDPIEDAIMAAMRKGNRSHTFELVDQPGRQSDSKIHRMGVEKLRNAGYNVEYPAFTTVRVTGWIKE